MLPALAAQRFQGKFKPNLTLKAGNALVLPQGHARHNKQQYDCRHYTEAP
jgi:hypothetical protein